MSAPDKIIFDPQKVTLADFKIMISQITTPESIDPGGIGGYEVNNSLYLSFNMEEKLARLLYTINIETNSNGSNTEEATCNFHLVFIYKIENLDDLANRLDDQQIEVHSDLTNALAAVTYSTARGVLLTKLQGTVMQGFVLPIIDPDKLLNPENSPEK